MPSRPTSRPRSPPPRRNANVAARRPKVAREVRPPLQYGSGRRGSSRAPPALPLGARRFEQEVFIDEPNGTRWPFRFTMPTKGELDDLLAATGFYDHAAAIGAIEDMLAFAETPQQKWFVIKDEGKPVARRGVDVHAAIENATVQLVTGQPPSVARKVPGRVYAALLNAINDWIAWEVVPDVGPKPRSYATWSVARSRTAPSVIQASRTPFLASASRSSSPASSQPTGKGEGPSAWTITLHSQPSP